MKKLSTLIALILCITIGGVYASWSYATSNIINSQETNFSNVVTEAYNKGAPLQIKLTNNALTLTIEQDPAKQYYGKLSIDGSLKIDVTVDPTAAAAYQNGVILEYAISVTYNGTVYTNFLTVDTAATELAENTSWTIDANTFAQKISLATDAVTGNVLVHLPTIDDYNEFKTDWNDNTIVKVTVSFKDAGTTASN
ncbi:MAG: hypothetical protein IKA12_02990 [Clostridia bacterium]|nr:hypothetical protein [Clostridia bacterium]